MSYFASTTPESDARNARLKAALFLQGSELYDVDDALAQITPEQKILRLEMAILYGKVHIAPFDQMLVTDLNA